MIRAAIVGISIMATTAIRAHPATTSPSLSPTTCASTPELQSYAIPPGSLSNALNVLALQGEGNLQIVYPPELTTGVTTGGASGSFTIYDVLRRLLAGTNLAWNSVNRCTFILLRATSPVERPHPPTPTKTEKSVNTLATVTVSGSLINNAQIQTATPTYTITAESIKARSFNSVAEVLQNSVFANGSVQGPQHFSSFTQGAEALNLYGLGPQFSLILIDGKPLADFGRLYNGSSNFNSISNIPLSMIERIDVMPGGSSSIYGSQAVAGVINIITRQHMSGTEVSVRIGTFPDGGGESQHIAFGYDHDYGRLNVLAALEFDNTAPIWGYDRALTRGVPPVHMLSPQVQSAVTDYGTLQSFTGNPKGFIAPPDGCDSSLVNGSTALTHDIAHPERHGQYCGTPRIPGYATVSNQSRSYRGMLKLRYDASDKLRIHGNFMLNWQRQRWFPGLPLWQSDVIEDADSGHILVLTKGFAPEELPGGATGQMNRQLDLLYRADIGATGQFGESNWDWDIYYLRSGGRTEATRPLSLVADINTFFGGMLGPSVGIDPRLGIGLYRPDYARFFQPIAPAQYRSFSPEINQISKTWINNTRATITNTSLFGLPGGDAGFAFLVEAGSKAWYAPIDPLFAQGGVYLHTAVGGGGRQSHLASAFELNLPLLRQLTLDLSGRYDKMSLNEGSENHRFTYKIGVEYRPFDSLLLRGSHSTVFKAPDLSASSLAPSRYYYFVTDDYQCALSHAANCDAYAHQLVHGTLLANPALRPTTAQTWAAGVVWSPASHLSLSLDYLHIAIRDEVAAQDPDLLMKREAQCRLNPREAESPTCKSITDPVTGKVRRAGANGQGPVIGMTTQYANLANETVDSITADVRYRFTLPSMGQFGVQLDYNNLLRHDYQPEPGQPTINRLADPMSSYDFKSILSGSVSWIASNRRWSSTLYGRRLGSTPNMAAIIYGANHANAGRVHPWVTFNWNLTYAPSDRLDLSLLINNIANKMPPRDLTFTKYPYFNYDNYNIYGREIMLQATFEFEKTAN